MQYDLPKWFCLMMAIGAVAWADPFSGATWIRDPVFANVPVLELFHRDHEQPPELSGPTHVHTLFRKEIVLKAAPVAAVMAITGDDYYKFFINDSFVVQGPAPAYHFAHPFFEIDVAAQLDAGTNSLAAHVYYQGLRNRVWNSADNRSGFILALDVRYADGTTDRFVTDETWRCFQLEAFPKADTIGYQTQFLEHIDMRAMPRGWRAPGFDDSHWTTPLTGMQDHVFEPQITPPLQLDLWRPVEMRRLDEGRYMYDFGQVLVGHTRVRVQGPEGHVITVRHAEELLETGEPRFDMRANCRYEEHPILSGEEDIIEFYDYRSFRYVEVLNVPHEPEVWVDVRHHPFDPDKSRFRSDNKLLEDIWAICRNGVQMGAQGVIVDCPSREKGQYLGDTVIAARSHLWLTADPSLTKKALMDFAHSRHIHSGLMAVAPGSFMQEIAEYSLQFPLLLLHYYRMSGDTATVRTVMDEVFEGLFAYFARYKNDAGLLAGIDRGQSKWVVVDWPANLRDNYDYDYSLEHGNTVLNAFYYGALRATAELERLLGRNGDAYDIQADRLAQAFARRLVDPDTGLYLDAPGSAHSSLHANAVPLAFGLTEGADPARMLEHIRDKRLACGVYIASYVIEACFRAGDADLGFALLTSEDERSWSEMLRHGATTCMEVWGPDQKWNTSWLHPWSSSPIYLIAEYVFGLSPAAPGWQRIRIAPAPISDLPAMELEVPLPSGRIRARYTQEEGYTYMIPADIPVEVKPPEGVPAQVHVETFDAGSPNNTPAPPSTTSAAPGPPEGAPDVEALERAGWTERVGDGLGLWVSTNAQRLLAIEDGQIIWTTPCSTALNGIGALINSEKTPPGWHRIARKIGDGAPWGQVFRGRTATDEIWQYGQITDEDLVLTRIFILDGLEPGINQGRDAQGQVVDSRERYIYIHGTNEEDLLGQPASRGCIRISNDAAVSLFDLVPVGTLLYIAPEKK